MRTRLRLPKGANGPVVLARVSAEPGVARVALTGRRLIVAYDPRLTRRTAIAAAVRAVAGEHVATGPLSARWQAIAEDARRTAPDDYPVGFRQRVREAYLHRYRHRRHGRRDDRPQHWRQYLDARRTSGGDPGTPDGSADG